MRQLQNCIGGFVYIRSNEGVSIIAEQISRFYPESGEGESKNILALGWTT
jgi:hypothetical protein